MRSARPTKMKTIGILGGMSDKATMEYYRFINAQVNERLGAWEIAETLICGVNFGNIEYYVRNNAWEEARSYIESKAMQLANAGADVIVCVSNTMHKVLDNIEAQTGVPFIHIAKPTVEAIQAQRLKKIILLGTQPVMKADYVKQEYHQAGIEIVVPGEAQQTDIDRIIFDELVKGRLLESSKQFYIDTCLSLQKSTGAQGVILGCTEILLLISQSDFAELAVFNTTELHANAAVDFALS
uniref:aspartate/glutamate racemase family protein n=1 Tax=Ningiella ruwaisensis TaxID=2364274 RepID=UPI0010A0A42D|nr:amino acid racemase [Ningiella ruwaisensis]